MKIIEHKLGGKIFKIFDAECTSSIRLRLTPVAIAGRDPSQFSYTLAVLKKQGDEWVHSGHVGIQLGKLEDIKKALIACIKNPEKVVEMELVNERHILKFGPDGMMRIPVCPSSLPVIFASSKEGMMEFKKAVSAAMLEMKS